MSLNLVVTKPHRHQTSSAIVRQNTHKYLNYASMQPNYDVAAMATRSWRSWQNTLENLNFTFTLTKVNQAIENLARPAIVNSQSELTFPQ